MKITAYGFGSWGHLIRYQGFYSALCLFMVIMLQPVLQADYSESFIGLYALLIGIIFFGFINLWIHPIVKIEHDGLEVKRFRSIKRKVKWSNIKLFKKVRTITRHGLMGLDPRYLLIKIKDAILIDRYVIILPFFKGYDEFVADIEGKLKKNDIITDEKYV